MPDPSDWVKIAAAANPDDVREHILTGYKAGKPFTPYEATIPLPVGLGSVLDFGCGLGRNFPYLTRVATRVTGFDLPLMIARCRELPAAGHVELMDDWTVVKTRRFDLVVASLVLQHIPLAVCRSYLDDIARLAPSLYLLSRVESDFQTNVFDAIHASGLFEARDSIEVDHDPETHQLRVIGSTPFDEVRRLTSGGHYEILLRSKVYSD